jgi:hypothetical protein
MSVYRTLVCHTCKKNYNAYGNHEVADKEAEENHKGHNYEFASDGEISGEYIRGREFIPAVYVPEYKEVDLI